MGCINACLVRLVAGMMQPQLRPPEPPPALHPVGMCRAHSCLQVEALQHYIAALLAGSQCQTVGWMEDVSASARTLVRTAMDFKVPCFTCLSGRLAWEWHTRARTRASRVQRMRYHRRHHHTAMPPVLLSIHG